MPSSHFVIEQDAENLLYLPICCTSKFHLIKPFNINFTRTEWKSRLFFYCIVIAQDEAQTMCEEQFEDVPQLEGVSSLDAAVVNVSQEIIDDYPASDPRWAEAVPAGKYME